MTYGSLGEIISSSLTIAFFILCVALPFIFAIFLIAKFPILGTELMRQKYGNMYTNLSLKQGRWIALSPFNFLARRFLIGLTVVYQKQISLQIITLLVGVLIEVSTVGIFQLYEDPSFGNNIYFNELIILTTMYSFICFTDFVPDRKTQEICGYAACLTVSIHIVVNVVTMVKTSIKSSILKLKRFLVRRNNKKVNQTKVIDL